MKTASRPLWPPIADEAYIELLLPAIQSAIASASSDKADATGAIHLHSPDVGNALLIVLANVLEGAPGTETNMGLRKLAEAAGKELHQLIREARELRLGDQVELGTVQ
jgi:hypothetical protein